MNGFSAPGYGTAPGFGTVPGYGSLPGGGAARGYGTARGDGTAPGYGTMGGVLVTPDSVASFAGLLADRSRAAMCLALIDGRAWTAGELAIAAGIGRSTASEHLTALVAAGLLSEEHQGRHRYLRLAGPEIASLVEDLAAVAGIAQVPRSLSASRAAGQLATARTCYDHVAGRLGVAIYDQLVTLGLIDVVDGLRLTAPGRRWVSDFTGGDRSGKLSQSSTRPVVRTCLDWTERRHHMGGTLGAILLSGLLARGLVVPAERHRGLLIKVVTTGTAPTSDAPYDPVEALVGVLFTP